MDNTKNPTSSPPLAPPTSPPGKPTVDDKFSDEILENEIKQAKDKQEKEVKKDLANLEKDIENNPPATSTSPSSTGSTLHPGGSTALPPLPQTPSDQPPVSGSATPPPTPPDDAPTLEPKKKLPAKNILLGLLLFLLVGGLGVGFYLSRQPQDIRQQAYSNQTCTTDSDCTLAGEICDNNRCTAAPNCISGQSSCGEEIGLSNTCCNGWVCQGASGQRQCQDPGNNDLCPSGGVCGGGSNGWYAFKCNQLTNGQCNQNPARFASRDEAVAYAGSCGQVDEVCSGGTNDGNLCGNFSIFSSGCSGGGGNPPPGGGGNPTPSTTPHNTLVCNSLSNSVPNPQIGDNVNFTCDASFSGSDPISYRFRYRIHGSADWVNLDASAAHSNLSNDLTITQPGEYQVQCRACAGGSCTPWGLAKSAN